MAYERRRVSTESDHSSTSTNHSTESNLNRNTISSVVVQQIIPIDQKPSTLNVRKTTYSSRKTASMNSPAEQILARTKNSFIDLNPYFQCSSLPSHWRKNKSLRFILRAKNQIDIKPNTRVTILAGNDYNPCATMKNNVSWFRDGQAEFNDLRFLGASGRGKKFTLTIIVETNPPQQCTYRRAIKITVDGPRKKREIKSKSDANETQADESNMDGDSDNDTGNGSGSTMTGAIGATTSSHGSSGLLLLAAAAEQKRKDDEDKSNNRPEQSDPMDISYSTNLRDKNSSITNCLSPSSLASHFRNSVVFSPSSLADDSHTRLPPGSYSSKHSKSSTVSNQPTLTLMKPLQQTNYLLNFTSNNNRFDFFNGKSTADHQTIVQSTTNSSSANTTTTHVLCR